MKNRILLVKPFCAVDVNNIFCGSELFSALV